jgi:hypothetical protein
MAGGDFYRCGLCAEHIPRLEFGNTLSLGTQLTGPAKFVRSFGCIGQKGVQIFYLLFRTGQNLSKTEADSGQVFLQRVRHGLNDARPVADRFLAK